MEKEDLEISSQQQIEFQKEKAEIYHGEYLCRQKLEGLLESFSLPNGLFPVEIMEMGYNSSSKFICPKQKHKTEHKFQLINKTVTYEAEVTAFIDKGRLRNIIGVKNKVIIIYIQISEIFIADSSPGKIEFAVPGGMSESFPVSAFEVKEKKDDKSNLKA